MKTNIIPLFAISAVLLTGCAFSGQNEQSQTEISSEQTIYEEETAPPSEYSHITIIQETTERSSDTETEAVSSEEQSAETVTELSEETAATEETLPIDEDSISSAFAAVDGSDIIYFGNIYFDSSLDSCGVIFLTADGRAFGGICGYLGDFRGNTYADYANTFTDITEFGQLSSDKAQLMTKYALSADPDGDHSENETDSALEYVSWYECITYTDSGEPVSILAHADEYGYSYSSRDIYIAEIAKTLSQAGIISDWQQYCRERLT